MTARLFKGGEFLRCAATGDEIFTPEEFSDEQRQIAETIDRFVKNELAPCLDEIERQNFPLIRELLLKCGELGILMIDVPADYGGLELDKVTSMYAAEKMAPAGSFFVTCGVTGNLGSQPLSYYGTREQKQRYLPKLATGEWVGAYCLTEPDSGSDALGAKTTATLSADGKFYTLNGTKQFITNGSIASLFTVFAKVDREHFTAFLVERGYEGVSTGAEEKKLGITGSSTTQVIFDQVRVPVENLLGAVGKGYKIAFNILNLGRLKVAAGTVGSAKSAFADGVAYANLRKQFGVPISSFGAMKEKMADMAAAIFASESLLYRLSGQIDARLSTIPRETGDYYTLYLQGIEEYAMECSIAKVFCTEVLARVADEVVQIHGGYGFVRDYPAERYYRDERINRIFEGTNEINRMLITTLVVRRAKGGELDLPAEAAKGREELTRLEAGCDRLSGTFPAEKRLLSALKGTFFVLLDAAVRRFGAGLKDEQEILMALAEVAIDTFALESAVLRAEKTGGGLSARKGGAIEAAVQVCVFNGAENSRIALKKAVHYIADADSEEVARLGIALVDRYRVPDLLQAKRKLADAAIEAERYPL